MTDATPVLFGDKQTKAARDAHLRYMAGTIGDGPRAHYDAAADIALAAAVGALDREALVTRAALALGGVEPCCWCPDDWRQPSASYCPAHGDGEWPDELHRNMATMALRAIGLLPETPKGTT